LKDAALLITIVISAFAILYVAVMPDAVGAERARADAAEVQVTALSTQVAALRPTPTPGRFYSGYPYYP